MTAADYLPEQHREKRIAVNAGARDVFRDQITVVTSIHAREYQHQRTLLSLLRHPRSVADVYRLANIPVPRR